MAVLSAKRRCGPDLYCESDPQSLPKSLTKRKFKNAPLAGVSAGEHYPSESITFWKVLPPLFAPSVSGGDLRTLLFSHGPALAEAPTQNHH